MDIHPLAFGLFAGLSIACSLAVVFGKNPVSSAFSLVLTFFGFAGIYAMLDAHFIAALQVLVYMGAIMVLFVFIIMLLNEAAPSFDRKRNPLWLQALLVAAGGAFLMILTTVFKQHGERGSQALVGPHTPEVIQNAGGNTKAISALLFSDYLLPFELTSILILVGIVGSVAIAMRRRRPE